MARRPSIPRGRSSTSCCWGWVPTATRRRYFPESKLLEERRRWVAAVAHGRPEVRITMTYPVIESSRHVAFLVAGCSQGGHAERDPRRRQSATAARVRPVGELIWFADRAAASGG